MKLQVRQAHGRASTVPHSWHSGGAVWGVSAGAGDWSRRVAGSWLCRGLLRRRHLVRAEHFALDPPPQSHSAAHLFPFGALVQGAPPHDLGEAFLGERARRRVLGRAGGCRRAVGRG